MQQIYRTTPMPKCNLIEITLRHWCSPVNFLHIFRTLFPKNTSGRLLLAFVRPFDLRISMAKILVKRQFTLSIEYQNCKCKTLLKCNFYSEYNWPILRSFWWKLSKDVFLKGYFGKLLVYWCFVFFTPYVSKSCKGWYLFYWNVATL